MLTASAFAEIREIVSRFYKLIFVDTGNNVRAQNWQAAMDATDQLVITMSARNDSAETAPRMLDHLEQSGRQRLVAQAVSVVTMPPTRKDIDLPAIQRHFAARTRAVLMAPYEKLIDSGEPIRYGALSGNTRDAWLKIAASVAEGLSRRPKDQVRASAAAGSLSRRNWAQRPPRRPRRSPRPPATGCAGSAGSPGWRRATTAPAVALPAVAAQRVQAAVVPGAGVRVRRHRLLLGQGASPPGRPAAAVGREAGRDGACTRRRCRPGRCGHGPRRPRLSAGRRVAGAREGGLHALFNRVPLGAMSRRSQARAELCSRSAYSICSAPGRRPGRQAERRAREAAARQAMESESPEEAARPAEYGDRLVR
jgi:hypothetical protein